MAGINLLKQFLTPRNREIILVLLVFFILALGFFFSPVATGDDWETFYGSARRILAGQNLYASPVPFAYYSKPPWVALSILSLSLLPFRWGCGPFRCRLVWP